MWLSILSRNSCPRYGGFVLALEFHVARDGRAVLQVEGDPGDRVVLVIDRQLQVARDRVEAAADVEGREVLAHLVDVVGKKLEGRSLAGVDPLFGHPQRRDIQERRGFLLCPPNRQLGVARDERVDAGGELGDLGDLTLLYDVAVAGEHSDCAEDDQQTDNHAILEHTHSTLLDSLKVGPDVSGGMEKGNESRLSVPTAGAAAVETLE